MHIEIMKMHDKYEEGKEVDHRGRNGLNNSLDNLHMVTHRKNDENNCRNTEGFPGTYWDTQHEKWRAYAQINGHQRHIGLFTDRQKAYDARINFLQERGIEHEEKKLVGVLTCLLTLQSNRI
jgi:hypothetical protein